MVKENREAMEKAEAFSRLCEEDKWEAIREAKDFLVSLDILNEEQPLSDILDFDPK